LNAGEGVKLERIPWRRGGEQPRPEELRAALEGEGFAVFAWTDGPCARYEPHQHEEDESLWMLAGAMSFEVEGARYDLAAGDRLMLPACTVHSAVAGASGASYLVGQRR